MQKEDENYIPILPDKKGEKIEEGFYTAQDGLAYVSLDRKVYLWVIEKHYQKSEDSAFLTEDNARELERVERPSELAKKLKSELGFMKRKASEIILG